MQKIRSFFSFILIFSLFFGIFSPFVESFALEDIYDYSEFYNKINISSQTYSDKSLEGKVMFDSPRTTFIFAFDGYTPQSSSDIEVEWNIDGKKYSHFLDIEWPDDYSRITTFPRITESRMDISYRIIFHTENTPTSALLISSFQWSSGKRIAYNPDTSSARAENALVVKRADWWADETLRYVSEAKQNQDKEDWKSRWYTPRILEETQSEHDRRIQWETEFNAISTKDSDSGITYFLKRYEWDNKLYWPIRKAKKIDRIVIHHTAENLEKVADDATLMRAIYFYHTKTKWWWDIGYNYVVWQRGQIYEWRAGGDYVEWAHVYGNNMGTVGISLMGNYETLHLNKDQKEGMLQAIEYIVRKYGINLDEQDTGATLCGKSESCIWKSVVTSRLMWHRDLAATSCPGKNLYSLLSEFRNTVVWKVWKIEPLYNPWSNTIDPVDSYAQIQYVIKSEEDKWPLILSSTQTSKKSITSSGWKPIKIRLSYPHEEISLESAWSKASRLSLDGKNIPYTRWSKLLISKKSDSQLLLTSWKNTYEWSKLVFSSDIVRIPSWSRIPAWDSAKIHNDNIFRWKIVLYNQKGSLLVINELPIEDYLKWLGEVSNTDLPEKVKTIIVAARSYAYYYINPKHRKYNTLLYDGSDDPNEFQKYLGYSYELRSPKVTFQVKATKWQVVTYGGELIKAWYFSSSDGRTLSYKEYCEWNGGKDCKDIPYLQSVNDPAWFGRNRSWHGVGISGIGATYGAQQWKTYKEILQYYLKWVSIEKVKN